MPLSFESASHGRIAFGFFHIETDLLLLENLFFFADEFCRRVEAVCRLPADAVHEMIAPAWVIPNPDEIGDLMNSIHGVAHTGFIGDLYLRFPFPRRPEEFRQNPAGRASRSLVRTLIEPRGTPVDLAFRVDPRGVEIGPYRFDRSAFRELVRYVWRGGWPRWRDGERPAEVLRMRDALPGAVHAVVRDLRLDEGSAGEEAS